MLIAAITLALAVLATPRLAIAQDAGDICDPFANEACGPSASANTPSALPSSSPAASRLPLLFYWGIGCLHCEEAQAFVRSIEQDGRVVERIEIRQNADGRKRFLEEVKRLGIQAPGIPLFVCGNGYVIGFRKDVTEAQVKAMIQGVNTQSSHATDVRKINLPLFGVVDLRALSLPVITLLIGLVDGINPCAMYVLVAMLGILLHARSRKRLLLFGGVFVLISGVVYFMFMTAWLGIFALTGLARGVTIVLGVALVVMGVVNLKELFWFKKGFSLMIPDKAKPGLFRRMRTVAGAASLPAALVGIATLAFLVNLIELGCTLGLPAVYTRILSLRQDLSVGSRYGYLALYNVAYIVPLAAIVAVYALTLHRLTLTERGAKVLKLVSGLLLVVFGVIFMAKPDLLQ